MIAGTHFRLGCISLVSCRQCRWFTFHLPFFSVYGGTGNVKKKTRGMTRVTMR